MLPQPIRPFRAALREEPHSRAVFDDQAPVAIPLGLMDPVPPLGRVLTEDGKAGIDEGGTDGHGSKPVGIPGWRRC
jgi:hypothetical protein